MLTLTIINTILCLGMTAMLYFYQVRRRPDLYIWKVALGRFYLITRTTSNKWIFYCVYAQDIVSILICLFGWPFSG